VSEKLKCFICSDDITIDESGDFYCKKCEGSWLQAGILRGPGRLEGLVNVGLPFRKTERIIDKCDRKNWGLE